MPLRTKNTYVVPGKGVVNTKKKTYTGKGKGPAGTRKVPERDHTEVPTVTTSASGKVTSSGYSSQQAAGRARRASRAASRSARRKTRALELSRQNASQRLRTSRRESRVKRTEAAIKADQQRVRTAPEFSPPPKPSSKPARFKGRKTAGTPSLKALRAASSRGQLKVNERGYLTTPAVRKAAKELKRAKATATKAAPRVSGPLTRGQKVFVREVARRTGLSPRVIAAQALAEQSGTNAVQREAEGNHNWLNIGYFDSGPGEITADSTWGNPKSAAKATSEFFKGRKYGPSEGIRAIISTRGQSDQAQIEALANSGWATSDTYRESIEGTHALVSAKPGNPKVAKRLQRAKKQAAKVGLRTAKAQATKSPVAQNVSKGAAKYFERVDGDERLRFVPLLARQLIKLARASGEPIRVNSGFRTRSEQEASYADYLAGGNLAAVPGTSNHEFGLAADLELSDRQRGMLSKFGLGLPVSGEDWHVEITDPTLRSKAGYDSPGSVSTTAYGGSTSSGAALPSFAVGVSGGTTAQGTAMRRGKRRRLTPTQKARRTFRRLREAGVGVGEGKAAEEGTLPTLRSLEAKYGVKTG